MELDELTALKYLLSVDGIGPQKILAIKSKLSSFINIYSASLPDLLKIEGMNSNLAQKVFNGLHRHTDIRKNLDIELEKLDSIGASLVTYWDKEFPYLLKNIYFPPVVLYRLGNFNDSSEDCIGIVGTRNPTNYGKSSAEYFAKEVAEKRLTTVSGLARGIDSIVHKSTIKFGGRTIAVIGSGLDVIYPPENKTLFEEIAETGCIFSEYELGTKPDAQNFPRRNRIISGLSLGVIVIETKVNGGAMQTASYALDQNREVFAVPGNINSVYSEGTNTLIKQNQAKCVTCIDDIISELNLQINPEIGVNIPKPKIDLSLFEGKIFSTMDEIPVHIDEISSKSEMSVSDCLVNLLMLEFKGLVRQLPGKMFSRI